MCNFMFCQLSFICCLSDWMQTITCLNALKCDNDNGCLAANLTKVLGGKPYLYSPACNSYELDCISSSPSQPAFSESGPSKFTPGLEGLELWEPASWSADFPPTKEDSSLLMKASWSLTRDVEACMSQSTEVPGSSCILRTLNQVTFSSNSLDPFVHEVYETDGRRYLYAPPSKISGLVD